MKAKTDIKAKRNVRKNHKVKFNAKLLITFTIDRLMVMELLVVAIEQTI